VTNVFNSNFLFSRSSFISLGLRLTALSLLFASVCFIRFLFLRHLFVLFLLELLELSSKFEVHTYHSELSKVTGVFRDLSTPDSFELVHSAFKYFFILFVITIESHFVYFRLQMGSECFVRVNVFLLRTESAFMHSRVSVTFEGLLLRKDFFPGTAWLF
jgi:hypothetical protein